MATTSSGVSVASSEPMRPMMELVDLSEAQQPPAAANTRPESSSPFDPSTSVVAGVLGNYIGAWRDERMKNFRPVGSFLDRSKLSLPRPTEIISRLRQNVAYFQSNYLLVFLVLCLYSALTAPGFLIALVVIALMWLYGWRWRQQPVHVRGYPIPEQVVAAMLGLVTIFMFYMTSVGDVVFWLLIVTISFVFLHALLYTPEPVDEFGFGAVPSSDSGAQSASALGFV